VYELQFWLDLIEGHIVASTQATTALDTGPATATAVVAGEVAGSEVAAAPPGGSGSASGTSPRGASTNGGPGSGGSTGKHLVTLLGPAFVAAVAYVDPGNVAANLTAGARYGYLLIWVLVAANVMACLVQYLSAKLGLATGHSLPELIGAHMRRPARLAFWAQAELVAMATDLAEVVGGAIALNLLFHLPLLVGGVITGAVSMGVLAVQTRHGQRPFEWAITGMLVIITIGFMAGLVISPVDGRELLAGLEPRFADGGSVLLAASMLGATVMPHAVYLHSSLTRDRHGRAATAAGRRRLIHATRWDVVISLVVAGSVNIAMLVLAAANLRGVDGTDTIEGAHAAIASQMGPVIGVIFAIGLLFSGLASTSVGCYAGSEVMAGLLHIRIPLLWRRLFTLIPALLVLWLAPSPSWALVLSQVALSLGIPFALVPLVVLTSRRRLMGEAVNSRWTQAAAWLVTALIVALNIALIYLTVTGQA
jgi:manganese transport protein